MFQTKPKWYRETRFILFFRYQTVFFTYFCPLMQTFTNINTYSLQFCIIIALNNVLILWIVQSLLKKRFRIAIKLFQTHFNTQHVSPSFLLQFSMQVNQREEKLTIHLSFLLIFSFMRCWTSAECKISVIYIEHL